ncbi:MAG: N-acetylmuramoyl-L-alanine amidase [Thermoleophilia bacterium]|jgi:N-acetylmuramoyl-L-alanine amidase
MAEGSGQEHEVQETVRRFETARARTRRARLIAGIIGALLLVAAISGGALTLAHKDPGNESPGDTIAAEKHPMPSTAPSKEAAPSTSASSAVQMAPIVTTTASSSPNPSDTTSETADITPVHAAPAVTTTASATPAHAAARNKLVVIDPGHQARGNSDLEPIGPGARATKAKVTSGTSGVATGVAESELVLAVAHRLRSMLSAAGVQVVMTRTSNDVNLSNIQRAQIANRAQADLFVRIHADGSNDSTITGIHVLYPASIPGWTDDIAAASKRAAALAQQELIAATGARDRGISARDDMTGFNWSDVPVILPEIGFMSNPTEDRLLATAAYQDTIAEALSRAILKFLDQ